MAPKKWTPKSAKKNVWGLLKSSVVPLKSGKRVAFSVVGKPERASSKLVQRPRFPNFARCALSRRTSRAKEGKPVQNLESTLPRAISPLYSQTPVARPLPRASLITSLIWRKSKWGLSKGGLRPLSATRAQLSAIVHISGLWGPFVKGIFVAKWWQL